MIPTEFVVALILTTLLLLYKTINIPNKYINTIVATALAFGTSISWCVAMVDSTKVYACIMAGIASIIFGLVLLVFTWHESIYIPEENTGVPIEFVAFCKYLGKFQLGLFDKGLDLVEISLFFIVNLNISIAGFRTIRLDAQCQELR